VKAVGELAIAVAFPIAIAFPVAVAFVRRRRTLDRIRKFSAAPLSLPRFVYFSCACSR
jgi:hypothetical protein